MLTEFIGFSASVLLSVLLFRNEFKVPEPVSSVKYTQLVSNIDLLNTLKIELESVENMIIDIELCSEHDLTNITVSNDKYNCSVLVNNKSELLKQLYRQRDMLRINITSLLNDMTVKN